MAIQKPIVAMIYDFDGTLAPGNMQEYDFLKEHTRFEEDITSAVNTLEKMLPS